MINIQKNFENNSIENLREKWRENHNTLLKYLKENKIPYFGLHGTPKERLDKILKEKKGYFNIATFYDKKKTEKRLFQLYYLAGYVSNYCSKSNLLPGGILIFNLEENKKNITWEWENLYPSPWVLDYIGKFSNKESKILEGLRRKENLLWRSDLGLTLDEFEKRFKGVVKYSEFSMGNKFKYNKGNFSSLPYGSLKLGFEAQNILGKVFETLQK